MGAVDGRFELEKKLGEGGYGEAWLARDGDGSRVVVKLLHKRLATDVKQTERFRREVVALERLRHPNVVALRASGTCREREQPYYAMDWSPGVPLDEILEKEGALAPERALRLADQLLDALAQAHAVGIVHRDLKPGNLLIEDPGGAAERVKVLDFGIAKLLAGGAQTLADLTANRALGTPCYMSPEQCRGDPVSPRSDVYSVGCMLLELLTGKPPFEAETALGLLAKHSEEAPPRLEDPLESRKRFDREVRLLRGLRHTALPEVYDHVEDGGVAYAVIQLVPGEDLRGRLRR